MDDGEERRRDRDSRGLKPLPTLSLDISRFFLSKKWLQLTAVSRELKVDWAVYIQWENWGNTRKERESPPHGRARNTSTHRAVSELRESSLLPHRSCETAPCGAHAWVRYSLTCFRTEVLRWSLLTQVNSWKICISSLVSFFHLSFFYPLSLVSLTWNLKSHSFPSLSTLQYLSSS